MSIYRYHDKVNHKRIVSRVRKPSKRWGHHWEMTLECKHVVILPDIRGKTTKTHCEKCALGLTPA